MLVIGCSSSQKLAAEVAERLGCEMGRTTTRRFPDGELFVKIDSPAEGRRVVVIQSPSRPADENLMELFFTIDALREMEAEVTVVLPYYGYGRQDRAFEAGEAVSSRTIAKILSRWAADFLTVNPHKEQILDYFSIPARSVDASGLIGDYFRGKELDRPVVVAPDAGSIGLAKQVAGVLSCRCANCKKKRLGPGKVVTSAESIELEGNDVIIVDDIIDSGGTIVEAAKALKGQGAGSINVACVHPVLTGNAAERILEVADSLVATNTIETDYSIISVAGLIAEAIRAGLD